MTIAEIIDVHTHTFRTPEAGIEFQRIEQPERSGVIEELLALMQQANVSKTVMLMYTRSQPMYEARVKDLPLDEPGRSRADAQLRAEIVERIIEHNQWGCQVTAEYPNLIPFLGLDPVLMSGEQMLSEMDDKLRKGARGVKIVPNTLRIYGNDRRLWPVYEECAKRHLPLLSQSGGQAQPGAPDPWSRPWYFAEVAREFPNMKIILAHMGRGFEEDVADLTSEYPNVFTDLSSRLHTVGRPGGWTKEEAVAWIRRMGVDRVMFGTNYPWSNPVEYVAVLDSLDLTEKEKALICANNAKRVIGL